MNRRFSTEVVIEKRERKRDQKKEKREREQEMNNLNPLSETVKCEEEEGEAKPFYNCLMLSDVFVFVFLFLFSFSFSFPIYSKESFSFTFSICSKRNRLIIKIGFY